MSDELAMLRIWKQDAIEKMAEQETELQELTDIIEDMQTKIDAVYRPMRDLMNLSREAADA